MYSSNVFKYHTSGEVSKHQIILPWNISNACLNKDETGIHHVFMKTAFHYVGLNIFHSSEDMRKGSAEPKAMFSPLITLDYVGLRPSKRIIILIS